MDIQTLQNHLSTLVNLPENSDAVISCYARVRELRDPGVLAQFEERVRLLRKALDPRVLAGFDQSLKATFEVLRGEFKRETEGIAVFARGGSAPFFLRLEFRVPLPNRLSTGSTPSIYPLVEFRDTYDRYVLVLIDQRSTRVLEIHLGTIANAVLAKMPDLRSGARGSWTREHYRRHAQDLVHRHVKEVSRIIDDVISTGAYAHLVLAGNPEMTKSLRSALSKRAASKIIDIIPTSTADRSNDVIAETLSSFVEQEQEESLETVDRLQSAICSHGLAVAGAEATLHALQQRQVDVLVIAQEYVPESAWKCLGCRTVSLKSYRPSVCTHCGKGSFREVDLKDEFARLAAIQGCDIETVHSSETLIRLGGVGCLLRYLSPDDYGRSAA